MALMPKNFALSAGYVTIRPRHLTTIHMAQGRELALR